MKAIKSVVLVCGNCEQAMQRMAVPHTEATEENEARLREQLHDRARGRGWRFHEYLEEWHCSRCARHFAKA
jgi:hypothetical protein